MWSTIMISASPTSAGRSSSRPAEVFGIKNQGLLKAGYAADVVVFDPETIIDKGTYDEPRQHPDGIIHVLVNGQPVVKDGKHDPGVLAGQVLRKGK